MEFCHLGHPHVGFNSGYCDPSETDDLGVARRRAGYEPLGKYMQSKLTSERSLMIISVTGLIFSLISFSIFFFLGMPDEGLYTISDPLTGIPAHEAQVRGSSIGPFPEKLAGKGLPIRLKIPAIYVNAPIISLGLASDGAMDVPNGPYDVGWFKLGQRPGEKGSAVMDGHFGWGDGIPAVFDDLHKLVKGDKIYVENDKGQMISFVVVGKKIYEPDANASDVFGSNDGKARLNLVTCGGNWDKVTKSYSNRLIVFTERVEEDS